MRAMIQCLGVGGSCIVKKQDRATRRDAMHLQSTIASAELMMSQIQVPVLLCRAGRIVVLVEIIRTTGVLKKMSVVNA